jgi:hypothetical protein
MKLSKENHTQKKYEIHFTLLHNKDKFHQIVGSKIVWDLNISLKKILSNTILNFQSNGIHKPPSSKTHHLALSVDEG